VETVGKRYGEGIHCQSEAKGHAVKGKNKNVHIKTFCKLPAPCQYETDASENQAFQ
jgi:hypothetical protein